MKKIATIVESRPKARTTSGKKIQACGFGQPARDGDRVDADAEDHRADVLGGGRLEQVRATAGAVADVVADEVRDDARRCAGRPRGCPASTLPTRSEPTSAALV